ncbi:MAG: peptidoglycan-associated lipoprotein Pal [Desulfobacterales bacterium]|nr:peptidoglycan-associated lipoprotein Pal [Desulfobacterales bacterium]MBF0397743.1 peptidoglycan-associated lipoprotein Pal [Desulfobacterales bacterium]
MFKRVLISVLLVMVVFGLMFTAACKKKVEPPAPPAQQEATKDASAADDAAKKAAEEEAAKRRALEEAEAAKRAAREAFMNEDINFDFDKSALREDATEILKKKAAFLKDNADVNVMIEGHCDERGTAEYNIALGEKRAKSAKNFLVDSGVDAGRLNTVSYGKEKPLDEGKTEEAWAKNRRAHFVIQ